MKLVDDWRDGWRWFSTQLFLALAVVPIAWAELPPDVRAMLPEAWEPYVLSAMAVFGILGRLVNQRGRAE